jgi:hypothetical protein
VGVGFVGLALGFELGSEGGDVECRLVSCLLKVALAFVIDLRQVLCSFVACFLEATVAVVSDGGEVMVEVP